MLLNYKIFQIVNISVYNIADTFAVLDPLIVCVCVCRLKFLSVTYEVTFRVRGVLQEWFSY